MILVAGENLIDLIPTGTVPGATPRLAAHPGGSPFNCARALGRLGVPVGYLTPISTDPMGALLADTLRADGVALLGGRRDLPAAQAVVTLQGGEARYRFHRTGTADRDVTLAGLRAALPRARTALHTGSLALMDAPDADALAALLAQLAHAGVMTSVDPNIRATVLPPADEGAYRARIARILADAGIIKMSVEDMRWLHPGTTPEEAAEALWLTCQPGLLVLTRGAAGVMAWHGSGRVTLPAAPVAALVWVPPTLAQCAVLACTAFFATAGHYAMTRAFAAAPLTVTQPVTLLQLIWASLLGALAFAEPVDLWVLVGGAIMIGAISYITWREARLRRPTITPPAEATRES